MKKFSWHATSNDGCFFDESTCVFDTMRECYNDMRNSALNKMKWNTEYDEDFSWDNGEDKNDLANIQATEEERGYIGYDVQFYPTKIIHDSYSGKYTYQIVEKEVLTLDELNTKIDEFVKSVNGNVIAEFPNRIINAQSLTNYISNYLRP